MMEIPILLIYLLLCSFAILNKYNPSNILHKGAAIIAPYATKYMSGIIYSTCAITVMIFPTPQKNPRNTSIFGISLFDRAIKLTTINQMPGYYFLQI